MYSEKSKFPLGALVVIIGVIVFGCIIVGALVIPKYLGGISQGLEQSTTAEAPRGSIVIDLDSSNTKEDWIDAVVAKFNAEQQRISSGEIIFVRVNHVTSGGSQKAILEGTSQPTVWSPGDQSWVDSANQVWRDLYGRPLVAEECKPTVLAPMGFAMWRPMAEALGWPDKPISWDDLVKLSSDPQGWATLGHPEWGQFKFGHTHPDYSNTGLLMLTALTYSTLGQTSGLDAEQVYSNQVIQAFRNLEQNTYHYGIQNRPLIQLLARNGPDYLHSITSSEAEVLKTNAEYEDVMRFPLVFIFPSEGTYWSEQPYCILDAEWVDEKQKQAAQIFRDYLLDDAQQLMAIDYYLRPINTGIPLHDPLVLEKGTDPRINPGNVVNLESPSAEVAEAIKDVFHQTKKKATVVLLLDTSGSMEGEKIKKAVQSSISFIQHLDREDEIYVIGFGGNIFDLGGGRAGDISETLSRTLSGLYASGGTPLYDAICKAVELIDNMQRDDEVNGEKRLYGIVLLSDGDDTSSQRSENQMFACLPSGESVGGVKIFTIAYGADADTELMLRIANRTNGKSFVSDPSSIESIYNTISAEQ